LSIIKLNNIHVSVENECVKTNILRHIDLEVEQGSQLAIVGRSGSGKSTLLYVIGLLLSPSEGQYYLSGEDVGSLSASGRALMRCQQLGFIFQHYHLLPKFNVLENIMLPLTYLGTQAFSKQQMKSKALNTLNMMGLKHLAPQYPQMLSGGEQQRVAIARAMICEPPIIVADEPTGALDSTSGLMVLDHLDFVCKQRGTTVVIVTHDSSVADRCDRVVTIEDGTISNSPA